MENSIIKVYQGKFIEDEQDITLMQLSRSCNIPSKVIIDMVEEGILDPKGNTVGSWRFAFSTLHKIEKIKRLQRDLRINLAGIALVVELLEKIEMLESKHVRWE